CELEPFKHVDPDTVKGVIGEFGRYMGEMVAPTDRIGDEQGATHDRDTGEVHLLEPLAEAYARYVEAGWNGVPFPTTYGGGGFPWLIGIVNQELFNSANVALAMAPLLTQGAIDLLLHHGDESQRERYLPKLVSGEWAGTMNLTEPDAGS